MSRCHRAAASLCAALLFSCIPAANAANKIASHGGMTVEFAGHDGNKRCLQLNAKKGQKFSEIVLLIGPKTLNEIYVTPAGNWEVERAPRWEKGPGGKNFTRFTHTPKGKSKLGDLKTCLTGTDESLETIEVTYKYGKKASKFLIENFSGRFPRDGAERKAEYESPSDAMKNAAKREAMRALLGPLFSGGSLPRDTTKDDRDRRYASKPVDAGNIFMQSTLPNPSRVLKVNYSRQLMTNQTLQYITVQPDFILRWSVNPGNICYHVGAKRNVSGLAVLASYPDGEPLSVKPGPATKYQTIWRDFAGSGGRGIKLLGAWNPEARAGNATIPPGATAPGLRVCTEGPGSGVEKRIEGFDDAVFYIAFADGEMLRLERDDAAPLYQPGNFNFMPEKEFTTDNLIVVSGSPQAAMRSAPTTRAPAARAEPARALPATNTGIVPPPPPADNGRTRLGGGALDIQFWQEESGSKTMYCFDIHNPTGRAIDEIEIGIGPVKIPFASGQAMWTRDRIQDWNIGPRPNASEQRQTLRFAPPGYAKGKPAAAREHIGKACFGAPPSLASQLPDMSQLQYATKFH